MPENPDEKRQDSEDSEISSKIMWAIVAGFISVFVGVLILVIAAAIGGSSSVSGGIIIFIGPFPIVVGAGPDAIWLILIVTVLAITSVLVFVAIRRKIDGRIG